MPHNSIIIDLNHLYNTASNNYWALSKIWNTSYIYKGYLYKGSTNNTFSINNNSILYNHSKCRLCKKCAFKRRKINN